MKPLPLAATLLALALPLEMAHANSIEQVLRQHYPRQHKAHQCYLGKSTGYYQGDKPVSLDYCMKIDKQQTVDTPAGKRHYILLRGDAIDLKTGEWLSSHVASGAVGMLVLRPKAGGGWETEAANTGMSAGAFGSAPEKWTLQQFGPGSWGFVNRESDVHQGYAGGDHLILLAAGNKISFSRIPALSDNTGALGDCSADMGFETAAAQRDCRKRAVNLDSRLHINRNATPTAGMYPLQLIVNGTAGGKRYRNQAYPVLFDAKQQRFLPPKNSPLNN